MAGRDGGPLFNDVAHVFPGTVDAWSALRHPAQALRGEMRIALRRRFGGVTAASDLTRLQSPSRLGVALRPYESGDPFRALSRAHLLRRDEYWIRTDFAEGRQACGILFHGYESMEFRSETASVCKGQTALCGAAMVELAHDALGHSVSFRTTSGAELDDALASWTAGLRKLDFLYVFTDALFDPSSPDAAVEKLRRAIANLPIPRVAVCIVRDPLELPSDTELTLEGYDLAPFREKGEGAPGGELRYSGQEYRRNLERQLNGLAAASREQRFSLNVLSCTDRVMDFVETLENFLRNDATRNRV